MATERNVPAPTPLALEQERASRRNLPTVCPEINFSRALFALKMGRGTERGLLGARHSQRDHLQKKVLDLGQLFPGIGFPVGITEHSCLSWTQRRTGQSHTKTHHQLNGVKELPFSY